VPGWVEDGDGVVGHPFRGLLVEDAEELLGESDGVSVLEREGGRAGGREGGR
jgi:hypothetical protein